VVWYVLSIGKQGGGLCFLLFIIEFLQNIPRLGFVEKIDRANQDKSSCSRLSVVSLLIRVYYSVAAPYLQVSINTRNESKQTKRRDGGTSPGTCYENPSVGLYSQSRLTVSQFMSTDFDIHTLLATSSRCRIFAVVFRHALLFLAPTFAWRVSSPLCRVYQLSTSILSAAAASSSPSPSPLSPLSSFTLSIQPCTSCPS